MRNLWYKKNMHTYSTQFWNSNVKNNISLKNVINTSD